MDRRSDEGIGVDMMTDFRAARNNLFERHGQGFCGAEFTAAYTGLMDEHLRSLFELSAGKLGFTQGVTLVALGGYGRGELAPFSDVDLLILTATPSTENQYRPLAEGILYPLWDLKLDVGHAVRCPEECLEAVGGDFSILASFLDGRFLVGDDNLYREFRADFRRWLGPKGRKKDFFKGLKESVNARYEKFGATPYLLEPNVKEGEGGLRDLHAMRWGANALYHLKTWSDMAARGLLAEDRVPMLEEAHSFMSCVRTHLQHLAGEKTDKLTFDLQVGVAQAMGYRDDGNVTAVDRFMQEYYTRVFNVHGTLTFFLNRVEEDLRPAKVWRMTQGVRTVEKGLFIRRGMVELTNRADVHQRPALMMRAFEVAATEGLTISPRSQEIIRTSLFLIDDAYRTDPAAAKSFLRGLTAVPPGAFKAPRKLAAMQDLDFLAEYIPELKQVRALAQHDAYHVYTVDVHQVLALWEMKKIAAGAIEHDADGLERKAMEAVTDREVLFLAALLHDIGKGEGRDHAQRGAAMIPQVGARLGLTPERTDDLAFLVAEHLFLMETATRRDLSEEKLIINSARRVGSVQRLHMLFLLTVADSRATGPDVWNHWKAGLARELYFKIHRVLTKSGWAEKEMSQRVDGLKTRVSKILADRLTPEDVEKHFSVMSEHYLSVMEADVIARHILLERQLGDNALLWEMEVKPEGYCEVTIITPDRLGLLSRMAGVFTLHNINILGAQVFTRDNQIALDVFQVEPPLDPLFADEVWSKVKRDTGRALTGHLALDFRLARKRPILDTGPSAPRRPSKVVIDNETSDFNTIVEVYTHDRLGLLYQLTKTLFDLQLSIYVAKISTKVDQVVDVFYVRDFFGQKLTDPEQIKELEAALKFMLKN